MRTAGAARIPIGNGLLRRQPNGVDAISARESTRRLRLITAAGRAVTGTDAEAVPTVVRFVAGRWDQTESVSALAPGALSPGQLAFDAPGEQPSKAPRILVVDDDPSIRSTVSEILEMEGYAVTTAANGSEALRFIETSRPSLVVLDMRMPVMDGWDFARELTRLEIQLPILVMTAAQNARRWAEEIGARGYVAKPFDLDDLIESVNRLLSDPNQASS